MLAHPDHVRFSYTPEDFRPALPDDELDAPLRDDEDDVVVELDDDDEDRNPMQE